jgi:hypothetical protein
MGAEWSRQIADKVQKQYPEGLLQCQALPSCGVGSEEEKGPA